MFVFLAYSFLSSGLTLGRINCVVAVRTRYGLDGQGSNSSSANKFFLFSKTARTGSEAYLTYSNGYWGSLQG
jgi:hypothetical protein